MRYEVWHVNSDELVGYVELGNPIDETVGVPVVVRVKGTIEDQYGRSFNAIEMKVCRMKSKGASYFALETNAPFPLLKRVEGFTPHVIIPTLSQMFAFGTRANSH